MELKALQAQINPHFLFNTINTIAMMIRTDPERARVLLREFAVFYRRTLESSQELITLGEELEYTRRYLVFEEARFGDRIDYRERVAPETRDVEVPAFIIQPVVENCIKHGMDAEQPLAITLTAEMAPGHLRVRVHDDGRGIRPADLPRVLEPGFGKGLGIALKNVDDRLRGYFGGGSGLEIASRPGEGTEVTLCIVTDPDVMAAGGQTC